VPLTPEALTEILRRLDTIVKFVGEALERMPARTSMVGDEGFATVRVHGAPKPPPAERF
jgi:hypothetical protein